MYTSYYNFERFFMLLNQTFWMHEIEISMMAKDITLNKLLDYVTAKQSKT